MRGSLGASGYDRKRHALMGFEGYGYTRYSETMKRVRTSGPSHVCLTQRRLNLDRLRHTERRFERRPVLSAFYATVSALLRRWAGEQIEEGVHTDTSLVGLCGGGVLFRAVAKDGTSTSPRISPPSPLDFLRRCRVPLLKVLSLVAGRPLSGGNGSVMFSNTITRRISVSREEARSVCYRLAVAGCYADMKYDAAPERRPRNLRSGLPRWPTIRARLVRSSLDPGGLGQQGSGC